MRPQRPDIAIPAFPPRTTWVGDEPKPLSALTARGPVLVHFFDLAQLNSLRALPYLLAWRGRYEPAGLTLLGVHSPRFAFTADRGLLTEAMRRLGIEHPVADDSNYSIWHDYGCRGWPALFLWNRGGTLRWAHFGEGAYAETEVEIAAALSESQPGFSAPTPLEPRRATDAPSALLAAPSPELFPSGSPREPTSEPIELAYEAGGAHAVLDGGGTVRVALDAGPAWSLEPAWPGLHELASHPAHERHQLIIEPHGGARLWAVSFEPGVLP
ncbi:MAG: hypothetical protein H0W09_07625 [Solirubrobacterales bacterium]|nr:hypothetical protein [Solirubrobacterales bacterium]